MSKSKHSTAQTIEALKQVEALGGFGAGVVVDAGGVDIEDLAPGHAFRRPDVADAGEQSSK